ncbi:hypothetical protein TRIATDRAFT_196979 [Trichoderma atroviride IMI 206040]|uniref:J domain-containing protein n=1 Tax=Hypocrea atroviridis (strain ATCC 20476 / IMI 206040) TaxID=452589 RepID=G9NUE1_HYPAI|nr:uncharacterized protein TRIATDRAFT_196979 [Trichoderma atroviride IMI 206040]EHK45672.1 hypothetical protein TRIATDRAFT_196979 [Trichoderma atroviride IMI 206040]
MSHEPPSPKRRHILSSINPDKSPETHQQEDAPISAPANDVKPAAGNDDEDANMDTAQPKRSRLKLKGEKRRHRSRSPEDESEAAFRESLFDAMADDEGAAYWEGVYGQPIHVYSDEKVGSAGELEKMTDEEYAAYVRQKMWEKTNAGLLEEKARREEERKRKKEEDRQSRKLREDMDRSLRRSEERRRRRRWADGWDAYAQAWSNWDGTLDKMAWPVLSGQRKDVNEEAIRDFFVYGLSLEDIGEKEFATKLKEERVRWHPDKIQQRLGGQSDGDVIKDVTAIFQIVDRLWGQTTKKTR